MARASEDAEKRFRAAQDLAGKRGFSWLPLAEVTHLPRADLLKRIEAIPVHSQHPNRQEAAAILGTVPAPEVTVSRAVEHYWSLTRDRVADKSPDQLRRWRNPRIKAARNFITLLGDKPISAISGEDMLAFRGWWLDRIDDEGLSANSANKDLIHLGDILKTVNKMKRLGLVLPLGDLALKEGKARPRLPFSSTWIREHLLAPGALDGLLLLDHPDDLRLGETALSHSSAPSVLAQTLHYDEGFRGGQVTSAVVSFSRKRAFSLEHHPSATKPHPNFREGIFAQIAASEMAGKPETPHDPSPNRPLTLP
ncbi:MAG: hypothetical protein BM562_10160 [Alphaproteobacteria bacterium MedPE-SWcel]|nr:MAG: hypothetical protein BM562_10160 [Alphaproteobacteria bacterium MedPE-SWcel]